MASADWNDVRFDYDGSLDLARRLWRLADTLDTIGAQRRQSAVEAVVQWRGRFGVEFIGRVDAELGELGRHAHDLRGAAVGWAHAWANAINLQNRRLDQIGGFLFGQDDIPPDPNPRAVPGAPHFHATGGFARY